MNQATDLIDVRRATAILAFGIALWCEGACGSLVVCACRSDAMFLASDSLTAVTGNVSELEHLGPHTSSKIFKVTDTCCAAVTGGFGHFFTQKNAGIAFRVYLPDALEAICKNVSTAQIPLSNAMSAVTAQFGMAHANYIHWGTKAGLRPEDIEPTRLSFWGYAKLEKRFFGASCLFAGTNDVILTRQFDSSQTPVYIAVQGEGTFLPSVIRDPDRLPNLRSNEFSRTVKDFYSLNPVSEERMVNFLLEAFEMQKKYASQFSSDKGWIGEPYVIYRINTEGITKIR